MTQLANGTNALVRLKEMLIEQHGAEAFNEALKVAEAELEAQDKETPLQAIHITAQGRVVK